MSGYKFTALAVPGGTFASAVGINNQGDVVGTTGFQPFIYSGGALQIVPLPDQQATPYIFKGSFTSISSSGEAVGYFLVGINFGGGEAAEYQNGAYTFIPSAIFTGGISSDGKEIVGYTPRNVHFTNNIAYIYQNGQYTTFTYENEGIATEANGVNSAGVIVGNSDAGAFSLSNGIFTNIIYPGATSTFAYGINDSGEIVGAYYDTAGKEHGFVDIGGVFSSVDFPGALSTQVNGVNDGGTIVGTTSLSSDATQAFIATPSSLTISVSSDVGNTNVIDHLISGKIDVADVSVPIELLDNGAELGNAVYASADGSFTATIQFAADGVQEVSAKATSPSGAVATSNVLTFDLDSSSNAPLFATLPSSTSTPAAEVYALYDAAFGRAPDVGGFATWTNAIESGALTIDQVTTDFLASVEFTNRYGNYMSEDPTTYVTNLYKNALHRAPDQTGLQGWVAAIDQGTSRQVVASGFAFSQEHLSDIQAQYTSSGLEPTTSGADVARLYYGLLDRAPDAGGLAGWDQAISSGTTLNQVAADVTASQEFTSAHSGTNADFVSALYVGALGRQPESQGAASWLQALDSGSSRADVALGISESSEAVRYLTPQINSFHLV